MGMCHLCYKSAGTLVSPEPHHEGWVSLLGTRSGKAHRGWLWSAGRWYKRVQSFIIYPFKCFAQEPLV